MAKIDKKVLKEQGVALGGHLQMARKRLLNFAVLMGKEGLVVEADPKKNPEMMRIQAKSNGGGAKGIKGQMRAEGKTIFLVVDEEPPGNFPKLIRQHFMQRGVPVKIVIELPGGATMSDGDDEDGAQPEATSGDDTPDDAPTGDDGDAPETPEEDKTGPVLAKAYGVVSKEMAEKLEHADETLRNALTAAEEGFKRAMESKEYEAAKAMLSQMKKAIAKIEPPSFFDTVVDAVKEKIEDVGEVIDEVKEKIVEVTDEIVEKAEDLAQVVGDAIGVLSENDKKQKEKLKDLDLPEAQQLKLVQLARTNPKSFEAAIAVMSQMDGKFGDLEPTPAGIAKAKEAVDTAKAEVEAANAELKTLRAAYDAAKLAVTTATAEASASDGLSKAARAELTAFQKSIPGDLTKLSTAEQANLITKMTTLKRAADAAKAKAEADVEKIKVANQSVSATTKAHNDHLPAIDAAKDKVKAEKEKATAAQAKKDMLDAVNMGALSPDAKKPMSDEDVAKVLGAFNVDPAFGQQALELVKKSDDRGNLADGIGRVTSGLKDGFKDKDGNAYSDAAGQRKYAESAMKMGAAMGGDYFENMDKFVQGGGLNKPDPATVPDGSSFKKLEQKRAAYVGGAMVGDDGKIDTTSPKAQEALAMMNFHPGSMQNQTPGMNMHFADMAEKMNDPSHKQKCQGVLDGITTPPTSVTGQKLVARNLGKAPGDVTKDDVKGSVMSAMFTPLDQGPVGSCFATGPARRMVDNDPAKAMAGITEVAMKGQFTTAQGDTVKAIKIEKLPADDNQLMRSWEYTVATAGAMQANSVEQKQLERNLFSSPDGMKKIKDQLPDPAKWPEVRGKIQTSLADGLTFRYDATSETGASADGSSTKGNFQIIDKSTGTAITTKPQFITTITRIALEAAGEEAGSETGVKIVNLCKSDSFITAVCPGKYKPWELPGGGFSTQPSNVLNGGSPTQKDVSSTNYELNPDGSYKLDAKKERIPIDPPGVRTTKVVTGLIEKFMATPEDAGMIDLSTSGIHAFGGTHDHPSLDVLKEGGDAAKAIEKHILEPGKKMATTDMAAEKTGMLFDQQLDTMGGWKLFSGGAALLEAARAKRPTEAMTPGELKKHVDDATEDLRDYMATERAKEWKKKQEDAGKVVSNAALAEKVESMKKAIGTWTDDEFSNNVIDNLEPPQFVIADTNWGNKDGHTFFVVIPDPITGEPKMFKKQEPSGKLTALEDKWINTAWQVAE